ALPRRQRPGDPPPRRLGAADRRRGRRGPRHGRRGRPRAGGRDERRDRSARPAGVRGGRPRARGGRGRGGAPAVTALAETGAAPVPVPGASSTPLVEIRDLVKVFPIRGGVLQRTIANVQAVDGVNLTINHGETLGLVGESGCGKTTVGRLLLRLIDATSGTILFDGVDISRLKGHALKPYRKRMQIIF